MPNLQRIFPDEGLFTQMWLPLLAYLFVHGSNENLKA